jgi:hypothetical protein
MNCEKRGRELGVAAERADRDAALGHRGVVGGGDAVLDPAAVGVERGQRLGRVREPLEIGIGDPHQLLARTALGRGQRHGHLRIGLEILGCAEHVARFGPHHERLDLADLAVGDLEPRAGDLAAAALGHRGIGPGLARRRVDEIEPVAVALVDRAPQSVAKRQRLPVPGEARTRGERQAGGVVRHQRREGGLDHALEAGAVARRLRRGWAGKGE